MKYSSHAFGPQSLVEVATALRNGLQAHFASVEVSVVQSPDMRPFGVASEGMGGSTALIEFGGEPYAHNPTYRGKSVDVLEMLQASGMSGARVFGAAMADMAVINGNAGEMISNVDPGNQNLSRVARVGAEQECIVEPYPSTICGPIANLFVSKGQASELIHIDVRTRIGDQISLTQCIRESLAPLVEGDEHIGLGGVFELVKGKVRSHVMPNYDCLVDGYYDAQKEQVVKDFLQFYEHMGPDLLFFTALWTGDPSGGDLNLRTSGEHTHFYHREDSAQQAGHYHGDVTPEEVHYRGYFNLAEQMVRFGDIYDELGLKP
jgi:hypothetical protein